MNSTSEIKIQTLQQFVVFPTWRISITDKFPKWFESCFISHLTIWSLALEKSQIGTNVFDFTQNSQVTPKFQDGTQSLSSYQGLWRRNCAIGRDLEAYVLFASNSVKSSNYRKRAFITRWKITFRRKYQLSNRTASIGAQNKGTSSISEDRKQSARWTICVHG